MQQEPTPPQNLCSGEEVNDEFGTRAAIAPCCQCQKKFLGFEPVAIGGQTPFPKSYRSCGERHERGAGQPMGPQTHLLILVAFSNASREDFT